MSCGNGTARLEEDAEVSRKHGGTLVSQIGEIARHDQRDSPQKGHRQGGIKDPRQ